MRRVLVGILLIIITVGFGHAESGMGWLGVHVEEMTPSMRDEYALGNRFGLLVIHVMHDSPADDAGLKEDDVILQYQKSTVEKTSTLSELIRATEPGSQVTLRVFRDGSEQTVEVVIGRQKQHHKHHFSWTAEDPLMVTGKPKLGVRVHALNAELAEYFKVSADQGVLVSEVISGSPADEGGLKAGDVITKINDSEVSDPEELIDVLSDFDDGDQVTVFYIRKGEATRAAVELKGFKNHFNIKIEKMLDDIDVRMHKILPKLRERGIMLFDQHGPESESI